MHAQNQGKLATVCLQRFSSIFESTIDTQPYIVRIIFTVVALGPVTC